MLKKLLDLAHEKLVNILGGHDIGTNIHACQPSLQMSIYVPKLACGLLFSTGTFYTSFHRHEKFEILNKNLPKKP